MVVDLSVDGENESAIIIVQRLCTGILRHVQIQASTANRQTYRRQRCSIVHGQGLNANQNRWSKDDRRFTRLVCNIVSALLRVRPAIQLLWQRLTPIRATMARAGQHLAGNTVLRPLTNLRLCHLQGRRLELLHIGMPLVRVSERLQCPKPKDKRGSREHGASICRVDIPMASKDATHVGFELQATLNS